MEDKRAQKTVITIIVIVVVVLLLAIALPLVIIGCCIRKNCPCRKVGPDTTPVEKFDGPNAIQ